MKKIFLIIIMLLLVSAIAVSVVGCNSNATARQPNVEYTTDATTPNEEGASLAAAPESPDVASLSSADTVEGWSAMYYRVDHHGYFEDVMKVCSADELRESYKTIQPQNMGRVNEGLFFNAEYNDGFFEDRFLILVALSEGSGSNRHKVTSIALGEGRLHVYIDRHIPEVYTDDMAGWIIAIEMDGDFAEMDVDVVRENVPMDVSQLPIEFDDGQLSGESPGKLVTGNVTNVTVSTPQELFDAIAPDTCITLKAGVYDLSTVAATESQFVTVRQDQHGYGFLENNTAALLITGVKGLTLQAETGAHVELVTPEVFDEVLMFLSCNGIVLSGITAGHTVTGEYVCDAGVVRFDYTADIAIENCLFYGCGSIGITLWDCSLARITDTTITDCSLRAVDISRSTDIVFTGCDFVDNRAYGCVIYGNGSSIKFIDCKVTGNRSLEWGAVWFNGDVLFERCVFRDNALTRGSEPLFQGSGISLLDCELEKAGFSGYWSDGSVADLGGNLLT